MLDRLVDAETAQRGYLVTSNREFLASYTGAGPDVAAGLQRLEALVADNPTQSRAVGQVSAMAEQRLGEMALVLGRFDAGDRAGAVARMNEGLGKRVMDAIRAGCSRWCGTWSATPSSSRARAARCR